MNATQTTLATLRATLATRALYTPGLPLRATTPAGDGIVTEVSDSGWVTVQLDEAQDDVEVVLVNCDELVFTAAK